MSETAARETFKKHVKAGFTNSHVQRFEDRFHSGIADMNVCVLGLGECWVEAKHLKALPVLKNTPIRVPLRREQVLWLNARKKVGSVCVVLIRVGLTGWVAFNDFFNEIESGLSLEEFTSKALYWEEKLDVQDLFKRIFQ